MASLGLLLSVLGLVLCGATSLRLSALGASTSKKPIIGKAAAGAREVGAGWGGVGWGRRWALPVAALRQVRPIWETSVFRVRLCAVLYSPRTKTSFGSC